MGLYRLLLLLVLLLASCSSLPECEVCEECRLCEICETCEECEACEECEIIAPLPVDENFYTDPDDDGFFFQPIGSEIRMLAGASPALGVVIEAQLSNIPDETNLPTNCLIRVSRPTYVVCVFGNINTAGNLNFRTLEVIRACATYGREGLEERLRTCKMGAVAFAS